MRECPSCCFQYKVKAELPKKLPAAEKMHLTPPLDIETDVKEKGASGYKALLPAERPI